MSKSRNQFAVLAEPEPKPKQDKPKSIPKANKPKGIRSFVVIFAF